MRHAGPVDFDQTLDIDGGLFALIGVLPPNVLRYDADLIRPLVPADYPSGRGYRDLDVFARLKPGVTFAQAQAEIDTRRAPRSSNKSWEKRRS